MENRRVYIGNLPYSVDDRQLRDLFSECGEIERWNVVTDQGTKKSKGFGFITFSEAREAETAIERFHQQDVGGRRLVVSYATPKPERRNGSGSDDRATRRRDGHPHRQGRDARY